MGFAFHIDLEPKLYVKMKLHWKQKGRDSSSAYSDTPFSVMSVICYTASQEMN